MASPQEFSALYAAAAERAGRLIGVDPSALLGQWGLETGWGRSIIPGTNNLGNIKSLNAGGVSAVDNQTGSRDSYRAYDSPTAFADDYAALIQRKYPGAVGAGNDLGKFAAALAQGGYAEDPRYAGKVIGAARMTAGARDGLNGPVPLAPSSDAPARSTLTQRARMATNDASSPEWESLAQKFGQPQAQQAAAGAADPWADLAQKFGQPTVQPERSARARVEVPASEPASGQGSQGQGSQRLANAVRLIPMVGPMMNGLASAGPERQIGQGAMSGFADVGNTLINAGARGIAAVAPDAIGKPIQRWNADRQASLQSFNDGNDSTAFAAGRIGGNVVATMPVGGVLGGLVKGAGALPGLTRVAPALNALGGSIRTGGMATGLAPTGALGQVGNMALRMAGGAVNGGVSAGLVDPSSAATGAAVGGMLPPVIAGAGKVGSLAAGGVRSLRTPDEVRAAKAILDAGGLTDPQEIAAVRAALGQQGPRIVAEGPTVPQILQNPGISQLARTIQNSGGTELMAKEAAQNVARLAALDRVSPVTGTVQQAAENFGNGVTASVIPAEAQASQRVRAAFDAVDPFNETRITLPLDAMQQAKDKFLGPGTFGTGSKADQALAEARRIGLQEMPEVTAAKQPGARSQPQTIVKAIRDLGGINTGAVSSRGMAGELADLRQAGLGSVMQKGRGQSLDTLAQAAHAQGFIDEADPALLLNALRDHAAGQRVVSNTADQTGMMQAAREAAMGDAPGATTLPKPVAFREIQNMRSSLGEAAQQASDKGANKEAAALRQMISDLDNQTARVAAGKGAQGDYFPSDIVKSWQDAVQLHASKMEKFHTGPQASIFRNGGDGQPQAQGAELAGKFFSPRMSQSADIASFGRIATPETQASLKNYAITDAANQTDRLGVLTNAKFNNWLNARSGALDGLMNEGERAQLRGVGTDLQRADAAASLNMARGSNTVQNALGLGVLDNKVVDILARRIPFVGSVTGPILEGLKAAAKRGKVERIGGLLADPEALDAALSTYLSQSTRQPMGLLDPALIGMTRTLPVLPAGSGRQ